MNPIRIVLPVFFLCASFARAQLPSFNNTPDSARDSYTSLNEEIIVTGEGEVKGYHKNGSVHYLGKAGKGKLTGGWQSWYANDMPCDSGSFIKGIPDGNWNVWYPDGALRFVRTYSYDKWQRFKNELKRYHPKRIADPLVQLYHTDKYTADKHLSAVHSFCLEAQCDRTAEEKVLQRLSHNARSNHYHPLFGKAMLHGIYVNYFQNGAIKDSGTYESGLPHGIWIHREEEKGNHWAGFYYHGRKHKEWKLYSATGKLLRIVKYKEGKQTWQKEINPSSGQTIRKETTDAAGF